VLLKVSFLEVNRRAERELGVSWFGAKGNKVGFVSSNLTASPATTNIPPGVGTTTPTTTTNNGTTTAGTTIPSLGGIAAVPFVSGGPFGVVLANLVNGGTNIDVMVQALETKGLVRELAEPNLMALSGDTATFLAGGEFPVPIAAIGQSGAVTPTIEYKPFGVQLAFTPTVLQKGKINLKIAPSVSQLDFANAVTISGTTVPSLIKRDAVTTIELRDGQSFAIAGLLQAMDGRTRDQIPWLGSVPVLGALFSSNDYIKQDTDLVIIVTPHLVQPAAPGDRLASPLDPRLPSNDIDFFLLSQTDVKKAYNDYVTTGHGIEGPYGHMLRVEPAEPVLPGAPAPVLPTLPISK
jgi:pilus assembly protein CpaC